MFNKITPVAPQSFSSNTSRGNREDVPAKKKQPSTNQNDGAATSNILFPDVMRALIEDQARMDPTKLLMIGKAFFQTATVKYESSEAVINQDPIARDYHIQNFLT